MESGPLKNGKKENHREVYEGIENKLDELISTNLKGLSRDEIVSLADEIELLKKQLEDSRGEAWHDALVKNEEYDQIQARILAWKDENNNIESEEVSEDLDFSIEKNGLHFAEKNGEFICEELTEVQDKFNAEYAEKIDVVLEEIINEAKNSLELEFVSMLEDGSIEKELEREREFMKISGNISGKLPPTKESAKESVQKNIDYARKEMGKFSNQITKLFEDTKNSPPLTRVLNLMNYDYHHNEGSLTYQSKGLSRMRKIFFEQYLQKFIPESLRTEMKDNIINFSADGNAFAILCSKEGEDGKSSRFLITDKLPMKYSNTEEYKYLSIDPVTGKPFQRFTNSDMSGRGFFDGGRLMRSSDFKTCRFPVSFVDSHYMVFTELNDKNKNKCLIVDGYVYKKSKSGEEIKNNVTVVPDSQFEIAVSDLSFDVGNRIKIGEEVYDPIGYFEPSEKVLGDDGFVDYKDSKYKSFEEPDLQFYKYDRYSS